MYMLKNEMIISFIKKYLLMVFILNSIFIFTIYVEADFFNVLITNKKTDLLIMNIGATIGILIQLFKPHTAMNMTRVFLLFTFIGFFLNSSLTIFGLSGMLGTISYKSLGAPKRN